MRRRRSTHSLTVLDVIAGICLWLAIIAAFAVVGSAEHAEIRAQEAARGR